MKIGASPPPPVPSGGGTNGNGGPKNPADPVVKPTPIDRVTISAEGREALEAQVMKRAQEFAIAEKLIDRSLTSHAGKDIDIKVGDVQYSVKDPPILNKFFRWVISIFK